MEGFFISEDFQSKQHHSIGSVIFIAKFSQVTIVLFDTPESRRQIYPLSLTRPVGALRLGIFTLAEKWAKLTGCIVCCLSEDILQQHIVESDHYCCINATVVPNKELASAILKLKPGMQLEDENGLIAFCQQGKPAYQQIPLFENLSCKVPPQKRLKHIADLVHLNSEEITKDFLLATAEKSTSAISATNTVIGNGLFLAPGVTMEACTINTQDGPVFIDENALVMEGTTIRGPVFIGNKAVVKMGARLYPGTSIGPNCVAGGEIKNSILLENSNKAHDGYLGDSYIGAWCNLGAGTSNSNVKNNAGEVEMWDQLEQAWKPSGLKCGTMMGDFSRTAVNTRLNTGTTIGICCSIHTEAFPPKLVPSFSWGPGEKYFLDLALRDAGNWKALKGQTLTSQEIIMLSNAYNHPAD